MVLGTGVIPILPGGLVYGIRKSLESIGQVRCQGVDKGR